MEFSGRFILVGRDAGGDIDFSLKHIGQITNKREFWVSSKKDPKGLL